MADEPIIPTVPDPDTADTITIDSVTSGQVDGNGVFDELMTSINSHLDEQYQKNRITGKEYATVYLGAMQTAMGQAIQFILGKDIAEKQSALLAEQANASRRGTEREDLKAKKEAWLIEEKIETEQQTNDAVDGVIKHQKDLIKEQVASEQINNRQANESLGIEPGVLETQIIDLASQTSARNGETTKKQDLLAAQKNKTDSEKDLIEEKVNTELAQVHDIIPKSLKVIGMANPHNVFREGKEFRPSTHPLGAQGYEPSKGAGLAGKQQVLLSKQTEGFNRDAEQKATKILMDSYAIRRSTDQEAPPPQKAQDPDIDRFLDQLATGVAVELTPSTYQLGGELVISMNAFVRLQLSDVSDPGNSKVLQTVTVERLEGESSRKEFKFEDEVAEDLIWQVEVIYISDPLAIADYNTVSNVPITGEIDGADDKSIFIEIKYTG